MSASTARTKVAAKVELGSDEDGADEPSAPPTFAGNQILVLGGLPTAIVTF